MHKIDFTQDGDATLRRIDGSSGLRPATEGPTEMAPSVTMPCRFPCSFDEYLARPELSSSQVKKALKHPALVHSDEGGPSKDTGDLGTMLHCAVLEPDEFAKRYMRRPEMPDPRDHPGALELGSTGTTTADTLKTWLRDNKVKGYSKLKADELKALAVENGAILLDDIHTQQLRDHGRERPGAKFISNDEYNLAERAHDAVRSHTAIQRLGLFGDGEAEVTFLGELQYNTPGLAGVSFPARARLDWLAEALRRSADLKMTAATDLDAFLRQAASLNYDLSAAFHVDVAALAGVHIEKFSWIPIYRDSFDSSGPIRVDLVTMDTQDPDGFFAIGRAKLRHALECIDDYRTSADVFAERLEVEHVATAPAWERNKWINV